VLPLSWLRWLVRKNLMPTRLDVHDRQNQLVFSLRRRWYLFRARIQVRVAGLEAVLERGLDSLVTVDVPRAIGAVLFAAAEVGLVALLAVIVPAPPAARSLSPRTRRFPGRRPPTSPRIRFTSVRPPHRRW
jgi:hypothetical protein